MEDAISHKGRRCTILIIEDLVEAETKKGKSCLVGKLHMERVINKEVVKNTM